MSLQAWGCFEGETTSFRFNCLGSRMEGKLESNSIEAGLGRLEHHASALGQTSLIQGFRQADACVKTLFAPYGRQREVSREHFPFPDTSTETQI